MFSVCSLISIRVKTSLSDGSVRPSDLLALFKQTGPKTRTHVRSAEFLDNTVELIREMVYTHSMDKPDLTGTHTHIWVIYKYMILKSYQHLMCAFQSF